MIAGRGKEAGPSRVGAGEGRLLEIKGRVGGTRSCWKMEAGRGKGGKRGRACREARK